MSTFGVVIMSLAVGIASGGLFFRLLVPYWSLRRAGQTRRRLFGRTAEPLNEGPTVEAIPDLTLRETSAPDSSLQSIDSTESELRPQARPAFVAGDWLRPCSGDSPDGNRDPDIVVHWCDALPDSPDLESDVAIVDDNVTTTAEPQAIVEGSEPMTLAIAESQNSREPSSEEGAPECAPALHADFIRGFPATSSTPPVVSVEDQATSRASEPRAMAVVPPSVSGSESPDPTHPLPRVDAYMIGKRGEHGLGDDVVQLRYAPQHGGVLIVVADGASLGDPRVPARDLAINVADACLEILGRVLEVTHAQNLTSSLLCEALVGPTGLSNTLIPSIRQEPLPAASRDGDELRACTFFLAFADHKHLVGAGAGDCFCTCIGRDGREQSDEPKRGETDEHWGQLQGLTLVWSDGKILPRLSRLRVIDAEDLLCAILGSDGVHRVLKLMPRARVEQGLRSIPVLVSHLRAQQSEVNFNDDMSFVRIWF